MTLADFTGALHILAISERGIQCATVADPETPFWLPRGNYVAWVQPPIVGQLGTAIVPGWLAAKHRQLVGDVEFERVRFQHANTQEENTTMNWKQAARDNSGALFRVPDVEKKTEKWPDYKGDVMINGAKWWISGWLRASEKTDPAGTRSGRQRHGADAQTGYGCQYGFLSGEGGPNP